MEMTVIQELQDKIIDLQYAREVSFVYPPSQHLRGQAGLSGRSVLSESSKCESLQKKNKPKELRIGVPNLNQKSKGWGRWPQNQRLPPNGHKVPTLA